MNLDPLKICKGKKVKVHTLDITRRCSESPPQKRSGMACVLKGLHSFTCTPTRSSAIGTSHTCLCLPSYNWYSFYRPWRDGRLSGPWCKVDQADSNLQPPNCKSGTLPHSHYEGSEYVFTPHENVTLFHSKPWLDNSVTNGIIVVIECLEVTDGGRV